MSTAKRDADTPRGTGALDTQPDQAATDHRPPSELEFHGATFQMRPASSPWGAAGPRPQSLVKLRPDCLEVRMRLQDGSTVVMPLGRLKTNP